MLETILEVSAQQVAGVRQPGKARQEAVLWYGRQAGRAYLGDRKLAVERPRLRRRERGRYKEVAVPAYAVLQDRPSMQRRMLPILMNGVSTRNYRHVIPEMAESVGIKIQREPGKRLFVIDGSKALRTGVNAVFGGKAAVQRCRFHKMRNVVERLRASNRSKPAR